MSCFLKEDIFIQLWLSNILKGSQDSISEECLDSFDFNVCLLVSTKWPFYTNTYNASKQYNEYSPYI